MVDRKDSVNTQKRYNEKVNLIIHKIDDKIYNEYHFGTF